MMLVEIWYILAEGKRGMSVYDQQQNKLLDRLRSTASETRLENADKDVLHLHLHTRFLVQQISFIASSDHTPRPGQSLAHSLSFRCLCCFALLCLGSQLTVHTTYL